MCDNTELNNSESIELETFSFEQSFYFEDGPHAEKMAKILVLKPFNTSFALRIRGDLYNIVPGPIASIVEKIQDTFPNGAVKLIIKN